MAHVHLAHVHSICGQGRMGRMIAASLLVRRPGFSTAIVSIVLVQMDECVLNGSGRRRSSLGWQGARPRLKSDCPAALKWARIHGLNIRDILPNGDRDLVLVLQFGLLFLPGFLPALSSQAKHDLSCVRR